MPEPNLNNKIHQDDVTEPVEEKTPPSKQAQQSSQEITQKKRAQRFHKIKDDIFRRRAKLMKRLAE